jgi:Holliday junction resolvasome RuvABC DNA-binding subunit
MESLSDEQAEILFLNHLQLADDATMRHQYWSMKEKEKKQENLPVDALKAAGYTDEEIDAMRGEVL